MSEDQQPTATDVGAVAVLLLLTFGLVGATLAIRPPKARR